MNKKLCAVAVMVALSSFCAISAFAAKPFTLKIGTSQTEQAMITRSYQMLADRLNEVSGGRLDVKVFPAGQLGSDEDVIEQAIEGVPVAVNCDASRAGMYVKDMGILMMGYFADNYDECYKITETKIFKDWEEELATKHGIRILAFNFYDGPRHFVTNVPINKPEDLKNLRIRTIGTEVCVQSITALGATPISMTPGEVYNGIQSGAIDGTESQDTSTYPSRLYEVAKYLSKTGHFQLMQGLFCGEAWFQTLPDDLKEIVLKTAHEVGAETAKLVLEEADKVEAEMAAAGMTIIEPDTAPFIEAVKPAYEKLGYTELREKLYKEIGKVK